MKKEKQYERFNTVYEGENGSAWVAWLDSHKADGWEFRYGEVTKHIDSKRFRAKVGFRREIKVSQ